MLTYESEAVKVPCPVCKMGARVNCRDAIGKSKPAHPLRHARAIATNGAPAVSRRGTTFKSEAIQVPCPVCRVEAGKPCLRKDGVERKSLHKLRHGRAMAQGAEQTPMQYWTRPQKDT